MSVITYDYAGLVYDDTGTTYDGEGGLQVGCRIVRAQFLSRAMIYHWQRVLLQARISRGFLCRAYISHRQQISLRAYVSHRRQIICKARINPTFTMQARVSARTTRSINVKTFIVWRQGWPILDPSDPGYPHFTPTQLIVKANIVNRAVKTVQTIAMRTYIDPKRTATTLIKARIGHGPQIRIGAKVTPKFQTTTATGIFNVAAPYQSTALGTFSVPGLYTMQNLGAGAKIARLVTKKATAHFTIPASPATGKIDTITAGATPMSNAQIGIGAYLA